MPVQNSWGLSRPAPGDPVFNLPTLLQTLTNELAPGPTGTAAPFGAGWINYAGGHEAVTYRRHLGRVWLQGLASRSGATAASTTVLTLPAGYRPSARLIVPGFMWPAGGTPAVAEIGIETDGRVVCVPSAPNGAWLSLTNLSFRPA